MLAGSLTSQVFRLRILILGAVSLRVVSSAGAGINSKQDTINLGFGSGYCSNQVPIQCSLGYPTPKKIAFPQARTVTEACLNVESIMVTPHLK